MKAAWVPGLLLLPLLVGCSHDPSVSASSVRELAQGAGEAPDSCPFDFDVLAALEKAGIDDPSVTDAEVGIEISQTTSPADDPMAAQLDDGATALDAAAGTYVSCVYEVGDDSLEVHLTASPAESAATSLLLPLMQRAAELSPAETSALVDGSDAPGSVVAPGGAAVLVVFDVDDGSAALLATGTVAAGDDLRTLADELAADA